MLIKINANQNIAIGLVARHVRLLHLSNFFFFRQSFSRLKSINLGHLETLVEVVELSEARGLEQIDLRDRRNLESMPVTDKLERLQVLNLSGCNEIKRFPRVVWTIRELNLEGTGIKEIRSETTKYSELVKQQKYYNFGINAG